MKKQIKLPQQYIKNMQCLLKDNMQNYLDALKQPPVQGLRVNTTKADDKILSQFNIISRVEYCKNGYIVNNQKIGKHPYHIAGLVYMQEPSSMMPVSASGLSEEPDKNLAVLDLCAAPGGKSGQIAEYLNGQGILVSNEIDSKRAKILHGNIVRMGYSNVIVTNESPERLSEHLQQKFDYIFVDAPCGGEGMFRKDPDTISEWKPERLLSNAKRQKDILFYANKMLKPNGKLIYSTCTFSVEEDENVVDWFLDNYNYSLVMPPKSVIDNSTYLTHVECRRFYPHLSKGEGQFVCVMKKPEEELVNERTFKDSKLGNSEYKIVNKFILDNFNIPFALNYIKIGDYIYLVNQKTQNMLKYMQKICKISSGVIVGSIEKDRLVPHINMFSAYGKYAKQKLNFDVNNALLFKYLHGEQLENTYSLINGYVSICVDGFAFAGVKVTGNALKNLYPKGLRI